MTSRTRTRADEARAKGPPLIDLVAREIAALMDGRGEDEPLTPADLLRWANKHQKSATYQFLKAKVYEDTDRSVEKLALLYCRRLIQRVKVTVVNVRKEPERVRAFVSLESDRRAGAGYRRLESVLAEDELRKELVETAVSEAAAWAQRAKRFEELLPVVEAIEGFLKSRPPKKG